MDVNKECYKTAMVMLELADTSSNGDVGMRATTEDPIWAFVAGPGRDLAKLVLSFKLGVKVGKGDLRETSKAKLLKVGLELKVLRMESNLWNLLQWVALVDGEGMVIEGGIREAVARGLVTNRNSKKCWGLVNRGLGISKDEYGYYGEKNVVYGRVVRGIVAPL